MRSESTSSDSFSGPNVSPSSRRSASVSCRVFLHPVSDCRTGSCAAGAAWCFQRRGAHKCGIDRRRNETVKAAALCSVMTGISAPAIFLNSPDDSQLARQKGCVLTCFSHLSFPRRSRVSVILAGELRAVSDASGRNDPLDFYSEESGQEGADGSR